MFILLFSVSIPYLRKLVSGTSFSCGSYYCAAYEETIVFVVELRC